MVQQPNIGIIVPPADELMDVCRAADQLGFHSLWAMGTPFPNRPTGSAGWASFSNNREPFAFLASVAAVTTRIRLGAPVVWTLMRDPVALAAEASDVDRLSNGRLSLGISQGQWPGEQPSGRAMWARQGGRLEEAIALLTRLWSGDEVSYAGNHFRVKKASISTRPVRPEGIPILVGGTSLASIRLGATMADGWVHPSGGIPERLPRYCQAIRTLAARDGRDPDRLELGKVVYLAIDDDAARARAHLFPLRHFYGASYNVDRWCAFGPPDQCAAFIQRVLDAGVKTVLLALPQIDVTVLERIHREVIPLLA